MIEMIQQTAWGHFFITLVSFVLLLLIVLKLIWQPLQRVLNERQEQVSQSLSQAEAYQAESRQMKANLQAEMQALQEKNLKDHQRLQEELKEKQQVVDQKVQEELKRLQGQVHQQLEADRQVMKKDMEDQVVALSVDMAEKILKRQVRLADHQDLLVQFESQIERLGSDYHD